MKGECSAPLDNRMSLITGVLFIQGVWLIIWVLCAASTLYGLDAGNASDGARGICWFFLLVSFYWTSQVTCCCTGLYTAHACG